MHLPSVCIQVTILHCVLMAKNKPHSVDRGLHQLMAVFSH